MTRALRKLGEFSCRCSNFSSLQMFFERERAERAEIATAARNTHRNKVCKFKLYYSRKFRVLRSTKVSNTFLHNSKPRDVIKFGLPVLNWAQKWFFVTFFQQTGLIWMFTIVRPVSRDSRKFTGTTSIHWQHHDQSPTQYKCLSLY